MPLTIKPGPYLHGDYRAPVPTITCDHCGQPINDARDAAIYWRTADVVEPDGAALVYLHAACVSPWHEARDQDVLVDSIALGTLPRLLAEALRGPNGAG